MAYRLARPAARFASLSTRPTPLATSLRARAVPTRGYADGKNAGQPFGGAPLYLSLAAAVGIGYYFYIEQSKPAKASASPEKPLVSALDKDKFVEFPLKRVDKYNHNTSSFTFTLPEGTATLLPVAGLVILKPDDATGPKDDKGNVVSRPYTPISSAQTPGEVTFLIKKYEGGKVTPWIFDLKPGDKVGVKGPFPKIQYKPNEHDQVAMIAGGSGITPMYQVLEHALKIKDDKTKFKLIFANVSPSDILLREEFDKFQKEHPDRFEAVYVVDKPDASWKGATGYITPDLIKQHVKAPNENVKIYVCGPPGQVKAVSGSKDGMKQGALAGALKDLGYNEGQVFKF